ncbi:MAG: NADH-quinone oxidoreductase subunit H [Candidatus Melainabacteria bacterium]|nr:NADH-quinone oxidoreductase subunit H [Candidatus Melainabacteria bacterium]
MKLIILQFISLGAAQILTVLLLSPFINTLIKKIKALLQGRYGPPLLQGYYDLTKYFCKESVVSKHASWIFITTPYIYFATTLFASLLIPTFYDIASLNVLGGIILLIYIFGLGRFFVAIASMEPGSGFCGMASSREMMLALLIEPVMLLALFVLVLMSGSTNIPSIINYFSAHPNHLIYPCYLLALFALFTASVAEMGRVPFDNPETHYELTMIHEGLLLEYSGKELGLMFWSSWTKQLLILSLLANLIFPWQISSFIFGFLFFLLKLIVLCILVALIETVFAKVRLFRVKDILITSFVTGVIALILLVKQNVGGFN